MSKKEVHRAQRLRASCDGCFLAKVKCTKAQPLCQRCLTTGIQCIYSPSSRAGKSKGNTQPHPRPQTMVPEPINLLASLQDNASSDYQYFRQETVQHRSLHHRHGYRPVLDFTPGQTFDGSGFNMEQQFNQNGGLSMMEDEHEMGGVFKLEPEWDFVPRFGAGLMGEPQSAALPSSHPPSMPPQWAHSFDASGMASGMGDLYPDPADISALLATNDGNNLSYDMGIRNPNGSWHGNIDGNGSGSGIGNTNADGSGLGHSNGHDHGTNNDGSNESGNGGGGGGGGGGNQMMVADMQPFPQGPPMQGSHRPPTTNGNAIPFMRNPSPPPAGSSAASPPKRCDCYANCVRSLAELETVLPFDLRIVDRLLATAYSALQNCKRMLDCLTCTQEPHEVAKLMVLVALITRTAGSIHDFSQMVVGTAPNFCRVPQFRTTRPVLDFAIQTIQELRVVYIMFVTLYGPDGELSGTEHLENLVSHIQTTMKPVIASTARLKQQMDLWWIPNGTQHQ